MSRRARSPFTRLVGLLDEAAHERGGGLDVGVGPGARGSFLAPSRYAFAGAVLGGAEPPTWVAVRTSE